jgi:hypothetical protein
MKYGLAFCRIIKDWVYVCEHKDCSAYRDGYIEKLKGNL